MSTTTVTGTSGEDRSDYTRDESSAIRQRSLRLLGSLITPVRGQLVLAGIVLVVSTALRVAGPALIAYGHQHGAARRHRRHELDADHHGRRGLPRHRHRRCGAHRLVRRRGRAPDAGDHARPAQAHLPAHAAAEPRVPRVVHVGPDHLAPDERPRHDPRAARRRAQRARLGRPVRRVHARRAVPRSTGSRADRRGRDGHPAVPADALVLHALAARLPRVARHQREGHRQVRRDDDRHPRRQGLPQGGAQRRRVRRAGERLPRRQHALDPPVRHVRARAHRDLGGDASPLVLLWGAHPRRRRHDRSSEPCSPPCCTCATSSRRCRRSRSS